MKTTDTITAIVLATTLTAALATVPGYAVEPSAMPTNNALPVSAPFGMNMAEFVSRYEDFWVLIEAKEWEVENKSTCFSSRITREYNAILFGQVVDVEYVFSSDVGLLSVSYSGINDNTLRLLADNISEEQSVLNFAGLLYPSNKAMSLSTVGARFTIRDIALYVKAEQNIRQCLAYRMGNGKN